LTPSVSLIKVDTPGLGLEDGAITIEVGEKVCAFDIAKRETDGTVTEDGTNEGRTVGASRGVGIGATMPVRETICG
jgi:hypothetical protein